MNAGTSLVQSLLTQHYLALKPFSTAEDGGNSLIQEILKRVAGEQQHPVVLSQTDAGFTVLFNWIELEKTRLACLNGEVVEPVVEDDF